MPIAVGIDLGTNRSALAIYMNEEIAVIPSENDADFLRSVVSFTSDGVLVGDLAEEQVIANPENTITEVKRIIGRRFDNPRLQEFLETVLYKVENVLGKPKISVNYKGEKRLYDPESISAMILKKLKMKAEIILGHKINSAVITVPSFFNDSQRQATRAAGSLAGLNVLQILNEPTAAAIAYGLDKNLKDEKNVLVYDFGSGMFGVSILKVKHGSTFETLATAGDINLGGIEINSALVDYYVDLYYKSHKKDIKSYPLAVRRLRHACSRAKIILSDKDEAVIKVDCIVEGIDFYAKISRSKLEELCEDIFNRSIELLHNVVVDSGLDKKDINDVVLVGGISKIPKIRQLISNYFDGKHVTVSYTPSLAVVYGAAIRAAFLSGYLDKRIQNMLCVDLVLLPIGIETLGGIMTTVIPRRSPIPTRASYTITTHTDNQPGVSIRIYEGERALTCNNHLLGTLEVTGLPLLPQGVPKVDVTFEIDSSGILTVSAEETRPERDGRKFSEITINLEKGQLSESEIERMIKEADEFEEEDRIARERVRCRNALESYVNTINRAALKDVKNKLSDRDKLEISKICHGVLDWIEENLSVDVQAITEKRKEAIQRLQPYAHLLDLSVVKKHACADGSSSTCTVEKKSHQ